MALNDKRPARDDLYQHIQYIRRDFTYLDAGKTLRIGALPANAVIMKPLSGVNVDTIFNAGTGNAIDIGVYQGTGNTFGAAMALGALGPVGLNQAVSQFVPVDTELAATINLTGAAASSGSGQIVIAYATKN